MDPRILDKIRDTKNKYEPEGFIILGVFGSYARGEETPESDVDILYEITPGFLAKFSGYKFFGKIADIKHELSVSF